MAWISQGSLLGGRIGCRGRTSVAPPRGRRRAHVAAADPRAAETRDTAPVPERDAAAEMSRREHLLPSSLRSGALQEQPGGFREALQAFLEASGAQAVDLPALQTTAWLVRLSDSSKLHVYEEELTADNFACDCCRIVGEWGGRARRQGFFAGGPAIVLSRPLGRRRAALACAAK